MYPNDPHRVEHCRTNDPGEASPSVAHGGPGHLRRHGLMVAAVSVIVVAPLAVPATASGPDQRGSSVAQVQPSSTDFDRSAASKAKSRFAGHRPGRIYLGMSCGEHCPAKEAQLGMNIGLKRWFKKWDNWEGVAAAIKEDRRKQRLPWISIEGPRGGTPTGWRDVGRGQYDRDIRQLAKVLKNNDRKPIFLSFDHEMSNNAPDSQGKWWARGFNRFHDVLQRAHALKRVSLAPLPVAWLFEPNNPQSARAWLPQSVLRRASFMGVDLYQSSSGKAYGQRLPAVDRWLGRHGHPRMMIGLGETGATNSFGNVSAATWLNRSLRWASRNRNKVVAISYFNSTANSAPNVYWPLDESGRKLDVFRKWLKKPAFVHRVR